MIGNIAAAFAASEVKRMDKRPVGVFDSGVGGISVLKMAMRELPGEDFLYYGDNAHMPYGSKPHGEIKKLAFACADFLVSRGAKAIVVACNTATSAAIDDIRSAFLLPVISIEPAIKPALEQTEGKVIMLATPNTCELDRYIALRERLDVNKRVIDVGSAELASRINSGAEYCDDIFDADLTPYCSEDVTAIVLGCTHYPFVKKQLLGWCKRHMKGGVRLFDGGEGTARQLRRVLDKNSLLNGRESGGALEMHTSGDEAVYMPIMRRLLEQEI